ncbi:DUF3300 domain-containing protein [Oleiharenicola sp. Vm1]|uniref:DUF3300 domain-containing protein n=1 Tax=Oleiharenicola sp. Vm1 TaxID=3398393 RepID=UPI0039F53AB0
MKTPLLLVCVATCLGLGRLAADDDAAVLLPPDQIETLVAPIALYPDPLVALILPATTHPADVVLASRFLANGGSPENVLSEPWDESVKALTRYREVVDYLDRNLDWTRRLGDCFIDQPDDVMDAIQAVRARARAAGMLADTPQQEVVVGSDEICILPTNPTVIYVPRYDPVVLCGPIVAPWYARTGITFGVAYGVGPWLSYDCDWRARHVRIAHRPPAWYYQPDWRRPHHSAPDVAWTRWTPPPRHDRRFDRHDAALARPPQSDRRWIGAGETLGRPAPDRRGDWNRSPAPSGDRDHRNRPDYGNRSRRETASPVASAPGVVATSPAVPTAPVVAAQPPTSIPPAVAPQFNDRRRPPRGEDAGPRFNRPPRSDVRPGTPPPPMTNPAPMTASPVGRPVRPPLVRNAPEAAPAPAAGRDDRRANDRGRWDRGRDRQQQN